MKSVRKNQSPPFFFNRQEWWDQLSKENKQWVDQYSQKKEAINEMIIGQRDSQKPRYGFINQSCLMWTAQEWNLMWEFFEEQQKWKNDRFFMEHKGTWFNPCLTAIQSSNPYIMIGLMEQMMNRPFWKENPMLEELTQDIKSVIKKAKNHCKAQNEASKKEMEEAKSRYPSDLYVGVNWEDMTPQECVSVALGLKRVFGPWTTPKNTWEMEWMNQCLEMKKETKHWINIFAQDQEQEIENQSLYCKYKEKSYREWSAMSLNESLSEAHRLSKMRNAMEKNFIAGMLLINPPWDLQKMQDKEWFEALMDRKEGHDHEIPSNLNLNLNIKKGRSFWMNWIKAIHDHWHQEQTVSQQGKTLKIEKEKIIGLMENVMRSSYLKTMNDQDQEETRYMAEKIILDQCMNKMNDKNETMNTKKKVKL